MADSSDEDIGTATTTGRTRRVIAEPCSAPSWKNQHWFPVASVHELDPLRPTPVCIDGLALVVWRIPEKKCKGKTPVEKRPTKELEDDQWRIFGDACPHRLAPLSEGRVEPETGCLQCAYHGWEFDADGKCKSIPSADIETCDRACQMSQSECTTYPVKTALGLLWAWLGDEPPKGSPLDLIHGTDLQNESVIRTYTRDLPYGYDTLLENLMDPAHIPFAHHGLQGTRKDAKPIKLQVTSGKKTNGISFEFEDRTMGKDRSSRFVLLPPFLAYYRGVNDDKSPFRLTFVCVPVSPGYSRLILLYGAGLIGKPSAKAKPFLSRVPTALIHLFSNRFLDSDLVFLHVQERVLRNGNQTARWWNTQYFMPAKVDKGISALRRWLEREGCNCVTSTTCLPCTPPREMLLSRYEQHTQYCRHCLKALDDMEKWQWRMGKVGLAAFFIDRSGAGALVDSHAGKIWQRALTALLVSLQIGSVMFIAAARSLKPSFYFVDYKHYQK